MGGECAGSRAGTGRGAGEEGPLAGAAPAGRLERRAGGRGGEGRGSGPRGPGLAGLGYPGHPPSPAGLRPPVPGPAVPQAQGDRARRSCQSPAFKVIREHREGRDF